MIITLVEIICLFIQGQPPGGAPAAPASDAPHVPCLPSPATTMRFATLVSTRQLDAVPPTFVAVALPPSAMSHLADAMFAPSHLGHAVTTLTCRNQNLGKIFAAMDGNAICQTTVLFLCLFAFMGVLFAQYLTYNGPHLYASMRARNLHAEESSSPPTIWRVSRISSHQYIRLRVSSHGGCALEPARTRTPTSPDMAPLVVCYTCIAPCHPLQTWRETPIRWAS